MKLEEARHLDMALNGDDGDKPGQDFLSSLDPILADFLTRLGLDKYGPIMMREEIDMAVLRCMTDADMTALGLTMGARVKIRTALDGV